MLEGGTCTYNFLVGCAQSSIHYACVFVQTVYVFVCVYMESLRWLLLNGESESSGKDITP